MTVAETLDGRDTDTAHRRRMAMVAAGLGSAHSALTRVREDLGVQAAMAEAGRLLTDTLRSGGRILACGNGGSLCDAMHFAEELTGNFRRRRRPLAAMALTDAAHLTCVANDYDFEHVFARAVGAWGRAGDVLVAMSASGRSPNILAAAEAARDLGIRTIALTGRAGSPLAEVADLEVATVGGGKWADRAQELHGIVLHLWVELIEAELLDEGDFEDRAG